MISEQTDWPDPIHEAAYQGIAGDVVTEMAPNTEADPVGLLLSFLVIAGNAIGSRAHLVADGAQHPARLNGVLVGDTSRGRKGTATANVKRLWGSVDPNYTTERMVSGLATGEGLIAAMRDGDEQTDRRLMVVEPEFARTLKVCSRDSSTLSAIIRQAWDDGNLRVLTRGDPLKASDTHISILGHITREELLASLESTDAWNGFANRFLFALVHRAQRLPSGGNSGLFDLPAKVRKAINRAGGIGTMSRDSTATDLWSAIYNGIDDTVAGLFAAATSRAEAQMCRLQVLYAALDGRKVVNAADVRSALAVWTYCEQSAGILFGDAFSDPNVTKLFMAIKAAGEDGMDGSAQRDLFQRNFTAERLARMRQELHDRGLVVTETIPTGRAPRFVSRWTGITSFKSLHRNADRAGWLSHTQSLSRLNRSSSSSPSSSSGALRPNDFNDLSPSDLIPSSTN